MVAMCLPSGASEGSCTVGKQSSTWESSTAIPYAAWACCRSISAVNGFTSMIPRW